MKDDKITVRRNDLRASTLEWFTSLADPWTGCEFLSSLTQSSRWQTAYARVGGVQPLSLEANWEIALLMVTKTVRRAEKMFTNAENVHTVERITKSVCRAGRCSQTLKMFTQWSGSLKRYAGLEDVHKRRKCSHRMSYEGKVVWIPTLLYSENNFPTFIRKKKLCQSSLSFRV